LLKQFCESSLFSPYVGNAHRQQFRYPTIGISCFDEMDASNWERDPFRIETTKHENLWQ